jgi:hypothetical protein
MPRSPDDDAPRWELPEWEEEPPSRSPSQSVPRWEPDREVPRVQPRRGSASRVRVGARLEPGTAPMRVVPPPTQPLVVRPFAWWAAHPWVVAWVLVFLAAPAVILLRALDEAELDVLVRPLVWGLGALFVVALVLAALASARRSVTRLVFGTLGVLAALGMLLWPLTQVTLGRAPCPTRAGANLGAPVAAGALAAWQHGAGGADGWRNAEVDGDWRDRSRGVTLLDYQLVDSGCWERMAPIDVSRTWHDFRVTVQGNDQTALSKSVVVHTAVGSEGWKITAIEGPLP